MEGDRQMENNSRAPSEPPAGARLRPREMMSKQSFSSPLPFAVRVVSNGHEATRVEVDGELDIATAPQLQQALDEQLAAGSLVVLDLSNVGFVDSSGLATILAAVRASGPDGNGVRLGGALPTQARRLIEVTGLQDVLVVEAR